MPFWHNKGLIDRSKKLPAFFYESARGSRPVREWVLGLTLEDRKLVGRDIQKVEFGWPLSMPYCRNLGNGLWKCGDAGPGPENRSPPYEGGALR